jgi:protein-histidine pros-kinase
MDKEVLFPENGNEKKEELSLDLFDDLNDAVVIMDEDGIILYCNRKAESIFGYAREKIVGKSLTRLMPERYREFQFSTLHQLIGGEEPGIMGELVEAEGLRPDGEEFPMEFSVTPLEKNGKKQFLSIIRDVSNKRLK